MPKLTQQQYFVLQSQSDCKTKIKTILQNKILVIASYAVFKKMESEVCVYVCVHA